VGGVLARSWAKHLSFALVETFLTMLRGCTTQLRRNESILYCTDVLFAAKLKVNLMARFTLRYIAT
jgi:hypothetical protein